MQVSIEQAKQTGMDTQQLVVCLSRTVSQRSHDGGLLPAGGLVVGSGLHYVASRQRPLLGLEELLLRGFPLSRLKYYNGMRYSDAVEIAALLVLFLVTGTDCSCVEIEKNIETLLEFINCSEDIHKWVREVPLTTTKAFIHFWMSHTTSNCRRRQ